MKTNLKFGRQALLMEVSKAELKEIEQLKKESLKGEHIRWDDAKKALEYARRIL